MNWFGSVHNLTIVPEETLGKSTIIKLKKYKTFEEQYNIGPMTLL
ncbi:15792_t:CDS:2 [Cetraspora pellucida]|uniref:15792_t:CDS:1 n=1 Tax=Cetraspora pellucida TaxID=1433469 RepID=A0A9N9H3Q8_9GLOM|nr:15792_t:CDS:2 [Cetraspora pellucida]